MNAAPRELSDAEIEAAIRAEWKRQGIPTDYMNGGHRNVTAWERAAFAAGLAARAYAGAHSTERQAVKARR